MAAETGGINLKLPTGGDAYGIPRYASTGSKWRPSNCTITPDKAPLRVWIIRDESCEELDDDDDDDDDDCEEDEIDDVSREEEELELLPLLLPLLLPILPPVLVMAVKDIEGTVLEVVEEEEEDDDDDVDVVAAANKAAKNEDFLLLRFDTKHCDFINNLPAATAVATVAVLLAIGFCVWLGIFFSAIRQRETRDYIKMPLCLCSN
ncbi:hypothetical protein FF38_00590 [Lucilia cuprina]|uniref:Uncharacterized protein n=1 Tax=Lucilia cuprina TaxID=7375 RepID=A0A0L0BQJ5_LUCCU|nr:hypothetical protein FF38_00590 [Lucilia cuprina]